MYALVDILSPISAIEVTQSILETVLLRREKTTKDCDGKPIVQLPSKTTNIEYLDLTSDESKLYDAIFKNVKRDYESFNSSGLINKNITSMLARIMTCATGVPFQKGSCINSSFFLVYVEQHAIPRLSVTLNWLGKLRRSTIRVIQSNKVLLIQKQCSPVLMTQILGMIHALSVLSRWGNRCLSRDAPIPGRSLGTLLENGIHYPIRCKDCIVGHIRTLVNRGKAAACPICLGPAKVNRLLLVLPVVIQPNFLSGIRAS